MGIYNPFHGKYLVVNKFNGEYSDTSLKINYHYLFGGTKL